MNASQARVVTMEQTMSMSNYLRIQGHNLGVVEDCPICDLCGKAIAMGCQTLFNIKNVDLVKQD